MISAAQFSEFAERYEAELIDAWLELAREGGYTAYTSTLSEAWRLGVQGTARSIAYAIELREAGVDPLVWPPDSDAPLWAFVVGEALMHRDRGVPLADYVALVKLLRRALLRHLDEDEATRGCDELADLVDEYFDLAEIATAQGWTVTDTAVGYERMAARVRDAVNEKNMFLTAFDAAPGATFIFDGAGRLQHLNTAAASAVGLNPAPGASYYGRGLVPMDVPVLRGFLDDFIAEGVDEKDIEADISFTPNDRRRYRIGMRRLRDVSAKFDGFVLSLDDITQIRRAEELLAGTRDRLTRQLEGLPVMIWSCDVGGSCDYFSGDWLRFTGRCLHKELGDGWAAGVHPADHAKVMSIFLDALEAQRPFEMEYRLRRRDGEFRWVRDRGRPVHLPDGTFEGFIGGVLDITDTRAMNDRLAYLSSHDPLTGLPNRRSLESAVVDLLQNADLCGRGYLLFIDIDGFKKVNDEYGHQAGDEVLISVAGVLSAALIGAAAQAFRVCGDEFAVLLPEHDAAAAYGAADRIRERVHAARIPVATPPVRLTVSIGVTPLLGQAADDALKSADYAMYMAKRSGGGMVSTSHEFGAATREQLLSTLRKAVADDELRIEAQPVFDIRTGESVYHECFVRIEHEGKLLRPAAFLPAARDAGLMPAITRGVLRGALAALAADEVGAAAIHLTAGDVQDEGLLLVIENSLVQAGVDPSRLRLELERDASATHELTRRWLAELRALGCVVVFHQAEEARSTVLRRLGVEEVKADGLLLRGAGSHPDARWALDSIVAAAHDAGSKATACFVESEEDLEVARALGFDFAQGYHLGRGEVLKTIPLRL